MSAECHGDALGFDHQFAGPFGLVDLHRDRADPVAPGPSFPPEVDQRPDPAFVPGSAGLNPLPNPDLFLGEFLVEERPLALLGGEGGVFPLEVGVIVGPPIPEPPPVEFDDPGGHPPEEGPVVGHEQEGGAAIDQIVFHPLDRGDVEMVGRLVEQEQVRLLDQGSGQERLTFAPARGGGERLLGVEAQMRQDGLDSALELPGIGLVEGMVEPIELSEGGVIGIGGQPVTGVVVADQQGAGIAQTTGGDVEHRAADSGGDVLFQPGGGQAGLPDHFAGIGLDRPVEELHQGALAGAVSAQQRHPLAAIDAEAGPIEKGRPAERDADLPHADQCHQVAFIQRVIGWPPWRADR